MWLRWHDPMALDTAGNGSGVHVCHDGQGCAASMYRHMWKRTTFGQKLWLDNAIMTVKSVTYDSRNVVKRFNIVAFIKQN